MADIFSSLTEDILFVIASYLSVSDLLGLSQTCKSLHALVSERALWREVIEDILIAAPQPNIQRRLVSSTAQELRTLAIKFREVDRKFSNANLEPRVFHHRVDDWIEMDLLPGGAYVVALSAQAQVALLSVHSGAVVGFWFDPAQAGTKITHAQLSLSVSSSNDIRLLVLADHDVAPDFKRTLWLLQVDLDRLGFELLALNPCDCFADFASAGGDRLVYTWEEDSREFVSVQTVGAHLRAKEDDRVEARFSIPREFRDETIMAIRVLDNDMLCVFALGSVALFHLPEPTEKAISTGAAETLRPYLTLPLSPRWTSFHTGPVIKTTQHGNSASLNFLAHGHLHTLQASTLAKKCKLSRNTSNVPMVSHAVVGCKWALRLLPPTTSQPKLIGIVETSPWVFSASFERADHRLCDRGAGLYQTLFVLPNSIPKNGTICNVAFDEWSGRVLIYSWDDDGGCNATFVDFC